MTRLVLGVLAYLAPTFALGFVWHLILFEEDYRALAIYRENPLVPFGFLAMVIQGCVFTWMYVHMFAHPERRWLTNGLAYAATGAILSWSFTTIAVAAKHVMTSVPDYLAVETAFTAVQWMIVGPLTALAVGPGERRTRSLLASAAAR